MGGSRIGIVGGSGLYQMDGLTQIEEVAVETPFGSPSDKLISGRLEGRDVVFLPLKSVGVKWVISISAVGSLRSGIQPLHVVLVDQFVDMTKARKSTFFDDGVTVHVSLAEPVCGRLAMVAREAASAVGVTAHWGGTYLCMEGPQFSTKGESNLYRQWGMDVIVMTNATEAKLAREAELCYSTVALVTDYDCWHETEETVSAEVILDYLRQNAQSAKEIVREMVGRIPEERTCPCHDALSDAVATPKEAIGPEVRQRLDLILGRFLNPGN